MRVLLLFLLVIATPVFAQEAEPLVGNWKLVAYQVIPDGELPKDVFGMRPKGYLILTREGRMMGILTSESRTLAKTDAERAELFKSMLAYSGKYRVEGKDFITTVDVSWNEAWNGTEQRRHYRFEGDKLLIETPPTRAHGLFPGKTVVSRLVWERDR